MPHKLYWLVPLTPEGVARRPRLMPSGVRLKRLVAAVEARYGCQFGPLRLLAPHVALLAPLSGSGPQLVLLEAGTPSLKGYEQGRLLPSPSVGAKVHG